MSGPVTTKITTSVYLAVCSNGDGTARHPAQHATTKLCRAYGGPTRLSFTFCPIRSAGAGAAAHRPSCKRQLRDGARNLIPLLARDGELLRGQLKGLKAQGRRPVREGASTLLLLGKLQNEPEQLPGNRLLNIAPGMGACIRKSWVYYIETYVYVYIYIDSDRYSTRKATKQ